MRHVSHSVLLLALICTPWAGADQDPPATRPAALVPENPAAQAAPAPGTVRVATWNIENWRDHFQSWRRRAERPADDAGREAQRQERYQNDEDNWEIAQVFLDPAFAADIVVFQEAAAQEEIEQFNTQWLGGMYETIQVFNSNDDRGQTIGVMMKPGFRVVATEDRYHQLPDAQDLNPRSDFLFARGPGFVLVEAPGGARFWVGTNHQKSKGGGNDAAMTRWRNAEAAATRRIMGELVARGPAELVFLGDINDELGVQAYELEGGGDVIASLVGPPSEGFVLATRPLAEQGQASFMGYWNPTYRSLIDHVVLSAPLAPRADEAQVFDSPWARVASDHLPVYVDLRLAAD